MIELVPGDIIIVRGRRFRHRISRLYLRSPWNHALLYFGKGETQELNWRGVSRRPFKAYYEGKEIAVFRLQGIDTLVSNKREEAFTSAMNEFQDLRFDWVNYFREIFGLPHRNDRDYCLCDEYVNRVYERAAKQFNAHDFKSKVDCIKLVKKDYSGKELLQRFNLIKIWDYRWK